MIYRKFGKRLFDIILSGLGLLLLSPIFLAVAILVRVNLGKPIFFKQIRPGYRKTPFVIIKFRTMIETKDIHGEVLSDYERVTKFGRFLRSTSLDELPELWNVFQGHMSIVGPRPLLMEYLQLYSVEQNRRHDVLPGITGLAQINGRNNLNWNQKFEFDLIYAKNISFLLDLEIIFRTIIVVLLRKDVVLAKDHEESKFKGSE